MADGLIEMRIPGRGLYRTTTAGLDAVIAEHVVSDPNDPAVIDIGESTARAAKAIADRTGTAFNYGGLDLSACLMILADFDH